MRALPREAAPSQAPDSKHASPLRIQRGDMVAFALIALLVICIAAVLYVAKALFLPVTMAFVVGTMLSPAAAFLERHRVPRPVSAVLIVAAAFSAVAVTVGLITAPLIEWTTRLPELASLLRSKLHLFDHPLQLWHQLQGTVGEPGTLSSPPFQLPKVNWVQPTIEFLSPTFTEILLFLATLVLFIASWRDLRRRLVMTSRNRNLRLQVLKILNEIEVSLGRYLLTVTLINLSVGACTLVICLVTGMPNPIGLGALAATLNFLPIIGPVAMFVILTAVGVISFPTLGAGLLAPLAFAGLTFLEGQFATPAIIGRRLSLNALAVFIAIAFWTWLWGPMGGFLASPLLIVGLIVKDHLVPSPDSPQLPDE